MPGPETTVNYRLRSSDNFVTIDGGVIRVTAKAGFEALAVVGLLSAPGTRAGEPSVQTVAIVTEFEVEPSWSVKAAMRAEIARIFRLPRLAIVWEDLSSAAGRSVHDRMVVVRFRGRCAARGPRQSEDASRALAFTHVTEGGVLPFAEVDCDRVRLSLSRAGRADPGSEADRVFGRASARVLAHEIYHMLTRTMDHGCRGIAKPRLTPQELAAAEFGFDPADLARIRSSLFERRLASSAPASRSAP